MYSVQQYDVYLKNKVVGSSKKLLENPLRPTFYDGIEFTTYLFRQSQICRAISAISVLIIKFLQDKKKYRKRRAKISADTSARLFRVTCHKVSGILMHKD